MPRQPLIKSDGQPFESSELNALRSDLDTLSDTDRIQFRNENAQAIAQHPSTKILVVSSPGTGKSTLFKQRINYWLQADSSAKILALSFVRKLVADLDKDIQGDRSLTDEQKQQSDVFTLHKYARSIVERHHGGTSIRFRPHFRIISEFWKDVVWQDTMLLSEMLNNTTFGWKNYEQQLHDASFQTSAEWQKLKTTYLQLCSFYNAAGFADLIIYAKEALEENSSLNEHDFFIIDEYQDFNEAEEELIDQLTHQARGLLVVGDDDQVLYEKLKSGKATLIRNLYKNTNFTNAMLPFCGRSSFHITKSAGHFIMQDPESDCIEKIYLPISTDASTPKVQMIGCAASSTAVDYIKKFIEDHSAEIEARKQDLANGVTKDPYLMILTPAKELKFYANKDANKELFDTVASFQQKGKKFSDDYYKILNYYSLANHSENNFTFRKVLNYERESDAVVIELVRKCILSNQSFKDITERPITDVLARCKNIKGIIDSSSTIEEKIELLKREITLSDAESLKADLEKRAINETRVYELEHEEEEVAELDELEIQPMFAVELLTIVGSKGLSADHVMIIGFDDVNMSWISRNAFYVALTRARKSLHLITALGSGGSQKPHSFGAKLPQDHIEYFKYTKSDRQKTSLGDMVGFDRYFSALTYNRRNNHRQDTKRIQRDIPKEIR